MSQLDGYVLDENYLRHVHVEPVLQEPSLIAVARVVEDTAGSYCLSVLASLNT